MSVGKFNRELDLPSSGRVTIKGPFDPQDSRVESAKILFLIVQGDGATTLTADGEGTWNKPSDEWSGTIELTGKHPGGGTGPFVYGRARGIALSIVTKPGKVLDDGEFDPPAFEALTWCANFKFVDPNAASAT